MSEFTVSPTPMFNRLPSSVKIGPIVYKIVEEEAPTAPGPDGQAFPVFGKISFKDALITLDKNLDTAIKWQCYFHEVMHAIFEMAGLAGDDEGGPTEGQVDALAYILLGFMLDNGWLIPVPEGLFPAQESMSKSSVFPFPHTKEKK